MRQHTTRLSSLSFRGREMMMIIIPLSFLLPAGGPLERGRCPAEERVEGRGRGQGQICLGHLPLSSSLPLLLLSSPLSLPLSSSPPLLLSLHLASLLLSYSRPLLLLSSC